MIEDIQHLPRHTVTIAAFLISLVGLGITYDGLATGSRPRILAGMPMFFLVFLWAGRALGLSSSAADGRFPQPPASLTPLVSMIEQERPVGESALSLSRLRLLSIVAPVAFLAAVEAATIFGLDVLIPNPLPRFLLVFGLIALGAVPFAVWVFRVIERQQAARGGSERDASGSRSGAGYGAPPGRAAKSSADRRKRFDRRYLIRARSRRRCCRRSWIQPASLSTRAMGHWEWQTRTAPSRSSSHRASLKRSAPPSARFPKATACWDSSFATESRSVPTISSVIPTASASLPIIPA